MGYSKRAKEYYETKNIDPVYCPTYSPELNSIELVFNFLKCYVKKDRLRDMLSNDVKNYSVYIKDAIKKLSIEKCDNMIKHTLLEYGIN